MMVIGDGWLVYERCEGGCLEAVAVGWPVLF